MAEQGCWQWLTVAQMLASPRLAPDLRSFLSVMEPGDRLGEVARKLDAFTQETQGQRLVEVAALGLVLATPLAITGLAAGRRVAQPLWRHRLPHPISPEYLGHLL